MQKKTNRLSNWFMGKTAAEIVCNENDQMCPAAGLTLGCVISKNGTLF
jgi:hypothetical protein